MKNLSNLICKQAFIKITREIIGITQNIIETEYEINLYENRLETPTHVFLLKEIYDVSYRDTSGNLGTLYLHTNQGVFPFCVRTRPDDFVRHLKRKL